MENKEWTLNKLKEFISNKLTLWTSQCRKVYFIPQLLLGSDQIYFIPKLLLGSDQRPCRLAKLEHLLQSIDLNLQLIPLLSIELFLQIKFSPPQNSSSRKNSQAKEGASNEKHLLMSKSNSIHNREQKLKLEGPLLKKRESLLRIHSTKIVLFTCCAYLTMTR